MTLRPPSGPVRKVYADRDFLLLWSGNALSLIGLYGVRIAYPLLVLALTGSPALAGWVGFASTLPSLIFQIPAGMVADYGDRRRTLLCCQAAGLVASCVAILVVLSDTPHAGVILVLTAFVEGSAYVFFNLSELAAIRDIVAVAQRPAALTFFEVEQPIGIVLGRAVGAASYGVARWLPFGLNALSYLLCLCTLSAIRGDFARRAPRPASTGLGSGLRSATAGFRVVWTEPFLRSSTLLSGLSNMIVQIAILLMLVVLTESGRPAWTAGVVLGAAGVGGILGSLLAAWLTARLRAQAVYRGSLWAWTALLIPLALTDNPYLMAAAWGCFGAIGTVVNVALTMFRVAAIAEDTLGRAVGAISLVTDGAVALGALLAGYLLTTFDTAALSWALVCAMLTLAIAAAHTGVSAESTRTTAVGPT